MAVKKASNAIYKIFRGIFRPFYFVKYRFKFRYDTSKDIRPPCLIVSNHATMHDQFLVGIGFKFGINFVASDGLFKHSLKSAILKSLCRPIPITKGSTDASAVRSIMRVIKSGGAVGIFAEGNRTFFGESGYIRATIGKLAIKLGVPLVIVNIRGGFNTAPRWAVGGNKGRMDAYVRRVVSPDELKGFSPDELNAIIERELYFNESDYNREKMIAFKGKRKAEYLESALFVCPSCKSKDKLHSHRDTISCSGCGFSARLDPYGFFYPGEGVPADILEWSKIQLEAVKNTDYSAFGDAPIFGDRDIALYEWLSSDKEILIERNTLAMYNDRLVVGGTAIPLSDIEDIAISGVKKRKMHIYLRDGRNFTALTPQRVNPLKYMVTFYHLNAKSHNEEPKHYGY